ncbi:hypothetical protein BO83DRAFT_424949 [Aspergillus eucalypticola CBS 122712]|uniref:Serine protease n=1 Tax=Aspergillus eucalypticola (strain CBS 122712 / IBT 29274) TaxID=1448314 RepID=A0A317VXF8_ASPEC|nr:uncharacterized protein BO83DRAFT_424949 [Aspergillus eucalypticola CBS 122712]PWY79024.1 hypothetical protein BO83DRAFT_424949 [Aspergillus eucalypticola CBS 122712]
MAQDTDGLNPLVWDQSWISLPQDEDTRGLNRASAQALEDWVVKLRFKRDGNIKLGTGFYINIPTAKSYVILTAAHNLVDANNKPSLDLSIERCGRDPIDATGLEWHVCPAYTRSRKVRDPDHDYGVIIVPEEVQNVADGLALPSQSGGTLKGKSRPTEKRQLGFGFSLTLSEENFVGKRLELTGYFPDKSDNIHISEGARSSNGECLRSAKNSLKYEIDTEPGVSGSPVWVAYHGHETVVAIHNNGPDAKHETGRKKGSVGARLSLETFQQIFEWVDVFHRGKALKAIEQKGEPAEPLYLNFMSEEECAWVHWSREELNCTFNIFPAYASTPNRDAMPLHVFQHVAPPDWPDDRMTQQWVLWDTLSQSVKLTDKLQSFCFAELEKGKPKRKEMAADVFHVVLRRGVGRASNLWALRMTSEGMSELDREEGTLDGPGLTFERWMHGKTRYVAFYLE